jgi:hypothetical protein
MTSVKATLTVVLKANDLVVAEVEDAVLWQRILTAIHNGNSDLQTERLQKGPDNAKVGQGKDQIDQAPGSSPVDQLASQLGISRALVEGGCSPTTEQPYVVLNAHCWEDMKKQLPERGTLAIAPIVAAATILALWFQKAALGTPTQAQAQAVLATINLRDPNASRSIRNAGWLQPRAGGQFVLNPAEISKSVMLAKCFCSKDWKTWKEASAS